MDHTLHLSVRLRHRHVMVVGPQDAAKTVLVATLANYHARLAFAGVAEPLVRVDIDPNHGSMALPGTLAAMVLARPLDPQDLFAAPASIMKTTPLVYYYGSASPLLNPKLYLALVAALAVPVAHKMLGCAGLIVDTPAQFCESAGLELLVSAIAAFDSTPCLT